MKEEKTNSIGKAVLSVSAIVIVAKIAGLIKQIVTASAFGATIQTDIIMLSEGLIANLDYLLIQSLATAFVPTYIVIKTEHPKTCRSFVSNTIKLFFIFTFCISLCIMLGAPSIAKLLAPSYSSEPLKQLIFYLRIVAPTLILIIEIAVFNALLKANERFVPGELVSFNQSIILILLIFLVGSRFGADTLIIGYYCYAVFNLAFLMVSSRKYWRLSSENPFKDRHVQMLLRMMGPLLLGYSMSFVNQLVDKIIVSGLGEGSVTAMNYAAVLSNFVGTFVGSICGVLFTYVTQHIAEEKNEEAATLTLSALERMVTLLLPITVLSALNAGEIVTAIFGRGKFGEEAVRNCAIALSGYAFMFVPLAAKELLSRFQFGYGDSKRPMINSTVAIVFNIVFSIVLSRFFGVLGVTAATSIACLICAILNAVFSRKRNSFLRYNTLVRHLPRWVVGAMICVVISVLGKRVLSDANGIIRFGIIVFVSFLGYGCVTFPLLKPMLALLHRQKK